jgi:hypothetical protein
VATRSRGVARRPTAFVSESRRVAVAAVVVAFLGCSRSTPASSNEAGGLALASPLAAASAIESAPSAVNSVPSSVEASPKPAHAVQIAAGALHTCALLDDGTVRCWGRNNNRQLGDGTQFDRAVPVRVLGIGDAIEIAVAGTSCARLRDGTVRCWGGYANEVSEPFALRGVHDAVGLVIELYEACARRPSGDLACPRSEARAGGPPPPQDLLF